MLVSQVVKVAPIPFVASKSLTKLVFVHLCKVKPIFPAGAGFLVSLNSWLFEFLLSRALKAISRSYFSSHESTIQMASLALGLLVSSCGSSLCQVAQGARLWLLLSLLDAFSTVCCRRNLQWRSFWSLAILCGSCNLQLPQACAALTTSINSIHSPSLHTQGIERWMHLLLPCFLSWLVFPAVFIFSIKAFRPEI